jgi:tetratricopeptide (TPR) repeat protein
MIGLKTLVTTMSALRLALLGSTSIFSPMALTHGSEAIEPSPEGPLAIEAYQADDAFVPAYLLAAVCGSRGEPGESAFERRLQLARLSQAAQTVGSESPPLLAGLGGRFFSLTTANDDAQQYFDQGLALTYAFNHPEALRAFRHARRLDPGCAMCYWGEAYVLGPNINAPMDPEAVAPAMLAVARSQEAVKDAGAKEKALIAALAARYSGDPDANRDELNRAYADAMLEVAARFPDDPSIQALYADALMNLSPWDYWEADGTTLKEPVKRLVRVLEGALAMDPKHPYAIHLYIHTVEASQTPERGEPYADRLATLMPGAGHIVHMPSHIYFRIGRFRDSIQTNRDAVAADESYLAAVTPPEGIYPYSYYPHNVHFLLESARMAGDAETAIAAAEKLPKVISKEVSAAIPWVQLIDAAPYFAHAQFSDPTTILRLPDPGDEFPYVKAMWHYARGVAYAARKDLEPAHSEAEAIGIIAREHDFSGMVDGGVPAPQLLELAQLVIGGRVGQAQGDFDAAVTAFREAAAIQDDLPYLEPPYWYYPVKQSLGAALLQQGRPEKAEQVFRNALKQFTNNAWTLYGLREALKAQGNASAVAEVEKRLAAAWAGKREDLRLSRL